MKTAQYTVTYVYRNDNGLHYSTPTDRGTAIVTGPAGYSSVRSDEANVSKGRKIKDAAIGKAYQHHPGISHVRITAIASTPPPERTTHDH